MKQTNPELAADHRPALDFATRIIEGGAKERREMAARIAVLERDAATVHGIRLALDAAGMPSGDTVFQWSEALRVEKLISNAKAYAKSARENADRVLELRNDLAEMRNNYEGACSTIAAMHAAAVGEVTGAKRGVVEDVADIRHQLDVEKERSARLLSEGQALEGLVGKLRVSLDSVLKQLVHIEKLKCIDEVYVPPAGMSQEVAEDAHETLTATPAECGKELAEAKSLVSERESRLANIKFLLEPIYGSTNYAPIGGTLDRVLNICDRDPEGRCPRDGSPCESAGDGSRCCDERPTTDPRIIGE